MTNISTGVGLYLEFSRSDQTQQLFVTSPMVKSGGDIIPVTVFNRLITPLVIKRWHARVVEGEKSINMVSWTDLIPMAEDHYEVLRPFFNGLLSSTWNLVGEPLFVELSRADCAVVAEKRMPGGAYTQVLNCRKFSPLFVTDLKGGDI
jgi:hypothetical protein